MSKPRASQARIDTVADALRACRLLFVFSALFGVAINLLVLAGPLYMLQIYDRVLASASLQTLAALTILVVIAYATLGLVDNARARLVARAGLRIERLLGERLVRGAWSRPSDGSLSRGSELLRELDTYRNFVGGPGAIAAIDLPFAPLFVAVIFLLHPWLGVFAGFAILLLTVIAFSSLLFTKARQSEARQAAIANQRRVLNVASAAESVRVMGMAAPLARLWRDERDGLVSKQAVAGDIAAGFKSTTKATRFAVQSLILGLGAFLVIRAELSPGGMIAASIILGRALAPIEQALSAWSQYNAAKTARAALDQALEEFKSSAAHAQPVSLPPIAGAVTLENVTFIPPGAREPIIDRLSVKIRAGEAVGVIGPSGSGKTTLARVLAGALRPTRGTVRYDGADILSYDELELGRQIGYVSQNVDLLSGSVRDNIARFWPGADEEVVEAAKLARVHQLILNLPNAYTTTIGEGGHPLSAGQRQRIGLARAFFGRPRVLILDEPNSNLDDAGELALRQALKDASDGGATIFVVTHRRSLLAAVDKVFALDGRGGAIFGPRDAVLQRLEQERNAARQQRFLSPPAEPTPSNAGTSAATEEPPSEGRSESDREPTSSR